MVHIHTQLHNYYMYTLKLTIYYLQVIYIYRYNIYHGDKKNM